MNQPTNLCKSNPDFTKFSLEFLKFSIEFDSRPNSALNLPKSDFDFAQIQPCPCQNHTLTLLKFSLNSSNSALNSSNSALNLPTSDLDFAQNQTRLYQNEETLIYQKQNPTPTLPKSHPEFRTIRVLLQSGLKCGG